MSDTSKGGGDLNKAKRVQNELQQYVKSKRIDNFIGNILEALIKHRPELFVAFIIDYLHQNNYEETKASFEKIAETYIRISSDSKNEENFYGETKSLKDAADVQAEVESYLKSKGIHNFLNDIVEKILTEKPTSPSAFTVQILSMHYLDASRPALDRILPKFGSKGLSTKDLFASNSKPNQPKKSSQGLSDSEDEEEAAREEKNDDESVATNLKPRSLLRRAAVSAESFDPNKLKDALSQIAIVPKSPEVTAILRKTLGRSPMLRALDIEQKEAIVRAFAGPVSFGDGENVIVQGEIGDSFYLLEEGFVDVFIQKKGMDEELKVHTYKAGDAFGQLALLYNAPRAATCRAQGQAKLWVLDRVSFKVIVVSAAIQRREKTKSLLRQVAVLEPLSELEMLLLADSFAEETYQDGYTVCKQGEAGNDFYIIKEGLALCYQLDEESGEEALVATLSKGQFFGEMALLNSKPRHATIRAKGVLRVQAIDRDTFVRIFGSMEDLMKRNSLRG